jgi:hypothetical protein
LPLLLSKNFSEGELGLGILKYEIGNTGFVKHLNIKGYER